MKTCSWILSLVLIGASQSAFAQGAFVSITPNHTSDLYSEGEHAAILFQNLQWPSDPAFSVNVEVSFPGVTPNPVLTLDSGSATFTTPALTGGISELDVAVHWVDRARVNADQNDLARVRADLQFWNQDLQTTSDPVQMQVDQDEINRLTSQECALREDLEQADLVVERDSLILTAQGTGSTLKK